MALKIQDVEFGRHYPFGFCDGAKPGYQCTVTLQIGDASYDRVALKLPPEATKAVLAVMIAEATKLLTVDPDSLDVMGAPGAPKPDEPITDAVAYADAVMPELEVL